MDSQFKQRLTGAVILVLLAVLLVPELLTGPKPRPSGPTSSAAATSQGDGAPLRSYDIDLSDTPQAGSPAAPPEPEAPAARESAAASSEPEASADDETPRPAARPASPAVAETLAGRTAEPTGTTTPVDSIPTVAMRGFAVQVGSFASRASADRLATDLGRRRFDAFVSPVRSSGRQLYRVRVGPVADRAAAQVLAARLKGAGQPGTVVSLP